ncbi:MAG: 16S rRNA (cytosine(1402)-N(4))-methyltransferase RsmH [Myxococcales bacterium]|nr:16S rRNA (cytosine(1402)-N(4))-methyltransferase RsmH [Myxococcota bacterium]MDW8280523.1 16S rRNA (cytosine(1402)-N(4))-methyltransferase RsmH [Myxococcales bacterium]
MSAPARPVHLPVMTAEALAHLAPRPGGVYCDATVGCGGHAEQILLASAPDGRLIGVDCDPEALVIARERLRPFGRRFLPLHGRFGDLPALLDSVGVGQVDGILADVGVCSAQLERPERGFSFQRAGPIDMRMDPGQGETALELILRLDEKELADILHAYGQERRARAIARALRRAAAAGTLTDTLALAEVAGRAAGGRRGPRDPATRTFQALRIAVNDELRQLDQLLLAAPRCLRPGGRLVLLAFHSLEDRIIKRRLRELSTSSGGPPPLRLLTPRPVWPSAEEVATNPRARSARLRAAARTEQGAELAFHTSGGGSHAP